MTSLDRSRLEVLAVLLGLALLGCSDDGVPLDDANGAEGTSGVGSGAPASGGTFTTTGGTNGGVTDGESAGTTGNDSALDGGESDGDREVDDTNDTTSGGWDEGDETTDDETGAGLTTGDPTGSDSDCTSNDHCALESYCDFPDDQCGIGSPGDCQPRPEQCLEIEAPVCGCDGLSYANACLAAANGIDVASDGPCR